jgi:serine/threonine-protein kinase OSR1/STK39
VEQIGRGMMNNQVWTAKCLTRGDEIVAVKLIDLATFNTQALESIKKEIQIMYWANHPNIVEFCSAFIDGSKLWLVMKLLEGSCLDVMRWCKPNGFDNERVIATILYQVLLGIKYLHVNRKMHRDIKAANILLDSDGVALLGDFTVSAILNDHEEKRFTFVGTPCWMAPEIVDIDKHRGYDFKADIWSLGVTAIELAYGKPPHADKQPMQVVMCIVEMPAPSLENPEGKFTVEQVNDAKTKWSPAFRDFVAKCCQKDPRKRPTASQLLKHKLFTLADKPEFLQKELLFDLPPPTQRFKVLEERRKAKEMAQIKQMQRGKAASAAQKMNLDV